MDIGLAKLDKTKILEKKNARKKIKVSAFTLITIFVAVLIFSIFNFIVIPRLEKKYSSTYSNGSINIKVLESENHFSLDKTKEQIASRKSFVPTIIMPGPGEINKDIPFN